MISTVRTLWLVPIELSDVEHAGAIDDFCALYFDAQDAGLDPVVGVEPRPDGDVFLLEFEDDAA